MWVPLLVTVLAPNFRESRKGGSRKIDDAIPSPGTGESEGGGSRVSALGNLRSLPPPQPSP